MNSDCLKPFFIWRDGAKHWLIRAEGKDNNIGVGENRLLRQRTNGCLLEISCQLLWSIRSDTVNGYWKSCISERREYFKNITLDSARAGLCKSSRNFSSGKNTNRAVQSQQTLRGPAGKFCSHRRLLVSALRLRPWPNKTTALQKYNGNSRLHNLDFILVLKLFLRQILWICMLEVGSIPAFWLQYNTKVLYFGSDIKSIL